jgi:diguanylate cyclase (GGDEF)-like protein/PAS domain S-box-containing protein
LVRGGPKRVLGESHGLTDVRRRRNGDDDTADDADSAADAEHAPTASDEALGLLEGFFTSAPVGLGLWDRDLRYIRVNDRLAAINDVPAEACLGRTPAEVLGSLGEEVEVLFRQVLLSREPVIDREMAGHTSAAPGDERHWVFNCYPVISPSDEVLGVGAVVVEVTDRKRAEEALRQSEDVFRSLVENATDYAIYMLDAQGRVMSWNQGAQKVKGYSGDEILGRHFSVFFTKDDVDQGTPERHLKLAAEHGSWEHEGWRVRKDGSRFWASTVLTALRDESGRLRGFSKVSRDTTEAKAMEDQLKRQALADPLTNLANRALFRDRVEHAFGRRERRDERLAVLFLDLDGFKKVNDTLGHDAGDQLLVEVAARLQDCVRPSDTAARMGGDEFAVLLDDLKRPSDAARVAERILEALSAPYDLAGTEVRVGASVGLVANPSGQSGDEAVRNADLAMYSAKQSGKGRYELFEPGMHSAAVKRLRMEEDLLRAVEAEDFELHYQPIVELETRRIAGVEALLRWHHPTDGLVTPSAFMEIAEETGLILPIGTWVLRQACAQGRWLQAQYPIDPPLSMSVNVSPKQFHHPSLVQDVARALDESHLPAQSLILEVTEVALLEGGDESVTKLARLKDLGVRLALDDFGTGYSSLTHLRRFPVDILSLDKKFVEGLRRGSSEWALAGAIVTLCETLELDTLAEGIERSDQLTKLKALGCDEGQGYYLGRPLDLDETLQLVKSS